MENADEDFNLDIQNEELELEQRKQDAFNKFIRVCAILFVLSVYFVIFLKILFIK
jgi:hypothetical protein